MAVPVSLRSKISNVMQLGKNRDSWMNINPEMRDELEMAYEGQMGQLKNELGSEIRSMGIPRRPDYPGGEAINRSQPTLIGGAIGKIGELMGGLGKKIVGEGYGQELGFANVNRKVDRSWKHYGRAIDKVRNVERNPKGFRQYNQSIDDMDVAQHQWQQNLDRQRSMKDFKELSKKLNRRITEEDIRDYQDWKRAEEEAWMGWHDSGASAEAHFDPDVHYGDAERQYRRAIAQDMLGDERYARLAKQYGEEQIPFDDNIRKDLSSRGYIHPNARKPDDPDVIGFSRWDDEFERHKREMEGQDWGADEAQRKSIRNINDEIGKLESHSKELADELSWIEDNKDALDPETYKKERIRIMGEWGKNSHRVRQLHEEKKKVGMVRKRDESIEESPYPTRHRPNDYDYWDPATQLEYDKMVQDIQHLDGRLEHTMNPDIRKALLADRFERAKAFKKRFGGDYDPEISPSRPPKYGKGSEQDRGDKLREMMTKTMYGSKGSVRPMLDMVGNVYRRSVDPDATAVSNDRSGGLMEDLQGIGSAAATASMVAGKGAVKAAIPQTALMMGLEEYTKNGPPPINIGGKLRFRGKGPRKVGKSGGR